MQKERVECIIEQFSLPMGNFGFETTVRFEDQNEACDSSYFRASIEMKNSNMENPIMIETIGNMEKHELCRALLALVLRLYPNGFDED